MLLRVAAKGKTWCWLCRDTLEVNNSPGRGLCSHGCKPRNLQRITERSLMGEKLL